MTANPPRERLVPPGELAVLTRCEGHLITALLQRSTIPGAVEDDEGTLVISRRVLRPVVEEQVVRRPVGGERHQRLADIRTPAQAPAIATILRSQYLLPLEPVVIAERPTEVGAVGQAEQLLRRQLGVAVRVIEGGPQRVYRVAAMLDRVDRLGGGVPRDADDVSNTGPRTDTRSRASVQGLPRRSARRWPV